MCLEPLGASAASSSPPFPEPLPLVLPDLRDHLVAEVPDEAEVVAGDDRVGVAPLEGDLVGGAHVARHAYDPAHPPVAHEVAEAICHLPAPAVGQMEDAPVPQVDHHGGEPAAVAGPEFVYADVAGLPPRPSQRAPPVGADLGVGPPPGAPYPWPSRHSCLSP